MKFPTMEEFAKNVAEKALDEVEYEGKTLREWVKIILATDINVGAKDGTNLAEVGTDCISRRAAIDIAKDLTITVEGYEMHNQAVMNYCADIMQLPPIQPADLHSIKLNQGQSSDMISRQDAIDYVDCGHLRPPTELAWSDLDVVNMLKRMPSAEPQERTGKWIYCEDTVADCVDGYRCDQCGLFVPWDYKHKGIDFIKDYHFCPNCGCKMEVTE